MKRVVLFWLALGSATYVMGERLEDCPKTGQATIPHPEDCHKFFDCWDGFGYEFTCPNATTGEQLVYNPTIGKCDYEGCNKTSTAASVVNNTLEIINSTEGNCKVHDNVDGWYEVANDCHKYLSCFGGVGKVRDCPKYTAFSPTYKICIWESMVKACKGKNKADEAEQEGNFDDVDDVNDFIDDIMDTEIP